MLYRYILILKATFSPRHTDGVRLERKPLSNAEVVCYKVWYKLRVLSCFHTSTVSLHFYLRTSSQLNITEQEMDSSDFVYVMVWINIRVCLPFTLIVFALGCVVRLDGFPVTFYMNLLVSNLIQLGGLVILMVKMNENNFHLICYVVVGCGALTSICFRTVIALERYFLISWPQLLFIRQTKGYVIFCVLIWLFAIFLFPLFMMYSQYIFFMVFPLIPTPVFFFCVARTPKFLPAATSLTTEEKCRIVATLILLLIVHIFMILPLSVYYINPYFHESYVKFNSSLILFLFSPFMDLILFVFMCKGLVDKLLMCFSCHSCSR
ncbi:uncharacterized protein LOC116712939 [Xiphophorus hellerii]|uniref:uncharacterized protein LOC116712939 n=1 Tax=Xiphophorus hellerii TaxID=8084 RepID=UPI0013B3CBFC|nr:uncharacterized protein LOC116712939 [Xiphophorus hellerii]